MILDEKLLEKMAFEFGISIQDIRNSLTIPLQAESDSTNINEVIRSFKSVPPKSEASVTLLQNYYNEYKDNETP